MKRVLCILVLVVLLIPTLSLAEQQSQWVCASCGKSNTKEFCTACGAKKSIWFCSNCQNNNPAEDAYCGWCGSQRTYEQTAHDETVLAAINQVKDVWTRWYSYMESKHRFPENMPYYFKIMNTRIVHFKPDADFSSTQYAQKLHDVVAVIQFEIYTCNVILPSLQDNYLSYIGNYGQNNCVMVLRDGSIKQVEQDVYRTSDLFNLAAGMGNRELFAEIDYIEDCGSTYNMILDLRQTK